MELCNYNVKTSVITITEQRGASTGAALINKPMHRGGRGKAAVVRSWQIEPLRWPFWESKKLF